MTDSVIHKRIEASPAAIGGRVSEEKDNFRVFFETMDDLIFIAKPTGEIIYTNDAVTRKLGYTQTELQQMRIPDVHPQEKLDQVLQIFGDMIAGLRKSCPLQLQRKDGSTLPVETRVWFGTWDGQECLFGIKARHYSQPNIGEKMARCST